jgi:UDP-GlcNAc3NAcA epimerase
MRILTIVGARPQFIKAAPVSRALRKTGVASEVLLHTGQHFDANMSDVFFQEMQLPRPDFCLSINGLPHGAMVGRMMEAIEQVLLDVQPDATLVYGDTNSTLAGALAAAKQNVPVAHVEAGLRSFDTSMPEEINRVLTDRISRLLYCPSQHAIQNLHEEGYQHRWGLHIVHVGDVMLDATRLFLPQARAHSEVCQRIGVSPGEFVLATFHRQENTDKPQCLQQICDGLNQLHEWHRVVVPLHPRTRTKLAGAGLKPRFHVIEPVGYLDMLALLDACGLVVTDSGGLQKEAFWLSKQCVTMREQTEWRELVGLGVNVLTGADAAKIFRESMARFGQRAAVDELDYGDGRAAERIASHLRQWQRAEGVQRRAA